MTETEKEMNTGSHAEYENELIEPVFWAFIDNENFPNFFKNRDLNVFERLYLFIGSNQKGLSVDLVLRLQPISSRVRFVLVEEMGKNNLDMYLIFYLGSAHFEADENTRFVVFSSDTDFDNIINHCNTRLNRPCIRITDEGNNPGHQRLKQDLSTKYQDLSTEEKEVDAMSYDKVIENIDKIQTLNPKSLPQRKSTLVNFISSIIRPYKPYKTADDYFQQLISEGKITMDAYYRIYYHLQALPPVKSSETEFEGESVSDNSSFYI